MSVVTLWNFRDHDVHEQAYCALRAILLPLQSHMLPSVLLYTLYGR
jgi:hypothetical protein